MSPQPLSEIHRRTLASKVGSFHSTRHEIDGNVIDMIVWSSGDIEMVSVIAPLLTSKLIYELVHTDVAGLLGREPVYTNDFEKALAYYYDLHRPEDAGTLTYTMKFPFRVKPDPAGRNKIHSSSSSIVRLVIYHFARWTEVPKVDILGQDDDWGLC